MSEDTIARIMAKIEEHSSKHRSLSIQDWLAIITLSVVLVVGVSGLVTSPINDTLREHKVGIKEIVKSLNDTKIQVAKYHGISPK